MQARVGKHLMLGVALALGLALLAACDLGGSTPPTATVIVAGTGTATTSATVSTATEVPATSTSAGGGPTNTAVSQVPPTFTALVAPTAPRSGNPVSGTSWRLVGLTGQELFAVAGSGQLDSSVYVGGTGLYRSTDAGATWNQLGFDIRTRVDEIAASLSNPKVLYAGSGTGCAGGLPGAQFRSDDGGDTWNQLPQAPSSLQVDPKDENLLTAITCTNVVRSVDGGQTWTDLADADMKQLGNHDGDLVRVPTSDNTVMYATFVAEGGNTRIRVSTDAGKTWGGDPTEYPGVTDLLVDNKQPTHAWALMQKGVLRTTDGGQTWLSSVTGLDAAHDTSAGSQGPYQLSALAAQYNESGDLVELYVGSFATESLAGAGIFSSKDGGQAWTRFGGDLGGRAIHSLHVTSEKNADTGTGQVMLYAATDDGIHKLFLNAVR